MSTLGANVKQQGGVPYAGSVVERHFIIGKLFYLSLIDKEIKPKSVVLTTCLLSNYNSTLQ